MLTGYEGDAFSSTGHFREDILSITAVHPMREDAVMKLLHKTEGNENTLHTLLRENLLEKVKYEDHFYYLVPVHKLGCLIYKVQVRGLPLLKIRDFTLVNERFQKWRNEEIGLYRRTLLKKIQKMSALKEKPLNSVFSITVVFLRLSLALFIDFH